MAAMLNRALSLGLHLVLFGYVAAAVMGSLGGPLGAFDESIPLVHGMLIQQGRIPHLDFPYFYPPLGVYATAGAFGVLGRSVISSRAVGIIFFLVLIALIYRLFWSCFSRYRSLVPAAVLVVAASVGSMLAVAAWQGFALALIALVTYLCAHSERHSRLVIGLSGVLTGLAMLYRLNFGIYAAAAIVCCLLLHHREWDRSRLKSTAVNLVAYIGPIIVCTVGICLLIYGRDIGAGVYQFTVNTQKVMLDRGFMILALDSELLIAILLPLGWFSFRLVRGMEELPPKSLIPMAIALGLVGLALAGKNSPRIGMIVVTLLLASVVSLHLLVLRLDRLEISVLIFYCCLTHYYFSRADWFHWRLLPMVESMLFCILVFGYSERQENSVSTGTALGLFVFAFCLLATATDFRLINVRNGANVLREFAIHPRVSDSERIVGGAVPSKAWTSIYRDPDELNAVRYVRSATNHNDPIFVGVEDHSLAFVNDLRFYWLSDRPFASSMIQLEPKVATELTTQRKIIADFENSQVKCLVIEHEQEKGDSTFRKSGYVGSKFLDEYISMHFREVARFGRFAVLTPAAP